MRMRVLIVDDSPLVRGLLGEFLTALGHEISGEAESPDEAVAAYQQQKPDLVALDLSLTGGDGFGVLERIRALDPKARIVVMTANTQKMAVDRALSSGAAEVLAKPFDFADIQAMFERVAG